MKKRLKVICAAAALIALLNADIKWPVIMAEAEGTELSGRTAAENGAAGGEYQEGEKNSGSLR